MSDLFDANKAQVKSYEDLSQQSSIPAVHGSRSTDLFHEKGFIEGVHVLHSPIPTFVYRYCTYTRVTNMTKS